MIDPSAGVGTEDGASGRSEKTKRRVHCWVKPWWQCRQSRLPKLQTQVAQLEEALASLKGEVAALVGQGAVEGGGEAEYAQHSPLSSDSRFHLTRYGYLGIGNYDYKTW